MMQAQVKLPKVYGISTEQAHKLQSESAKRLDIDKFFCDPFLDDSGLKSPVLAVIPTGWFLLGSPPGEQGRSENESPQQKVKVETPFAISRHLVSVAEFERAFAWHLEIPEGFARENCPCFGVNKLMAQEYAQWLSDKTGRCYRLPSEAEWEYAARAGKATRFFFGNALSEDQTYHIHLQELTERSSFLENPWGLLGVHGSLWEWVEDDWYSNYNGHSGTTKPRSGNRRRAVLRGGCWHAGINRSRSASRTVTSPENKSSDFGFRLVRELA